jgi:chromosome segregation ATPase
MGTTQVSSEAKLTVENIGGIDRTEVTFEPGITILAGRNATNRTSLLRAIMAAMGSNDVSIKADAEEGRVELTLDGETYTRRLHRENGTTHLTGDPYLEDTTLADLFAFLLESNEARRAVVTEKDLRDILMRPIDTDEIQADIDRLLEQRRQVSEKLEELGDLKGRLPSLEEQRTQLREEIEKTEAELQEVEAEIEARDADVEAGREEQQEVEARLAELRETRSELEDVRYDLDTEQQSLESLRAEKRELERDREELPERPAERLDGIEDRIEELRAEKQDLETELNEIQSVISFNEERLADGAEMFAEAFDDDTDSGSVTDDLLPEEHLTCWTCGSEVESEQIETTVDRLQELSQECVAEISSIDDELGELTDQQRELRQQQRRREKLDRRQQELEAELAETESRIEELSERRDALREEVETVETEVERLESDDYDEILGLHKDANQLEYELGQLDTELERVEENIAAIEDRLAEEADLTSRRDELTDEIEALRTRIERIEKDAIEEFNDHMETVLELLAYDNLARVWLERRETEVRDGRQKATKSVFDLHVVRQTSSGTTYEDTVDNLSESERAVTGLVFALAGYLAHDVHEVLPVMLLDSLEAIDSERVATLIEYLEDSADYLVVALLSEDADALGDEHRRVTGI